MAEVNENALAIAAASCRAGTFSALTMDEHRDLCRAAIRAYIAALRPEGEAVAWRWRHLGETKWQLHHYRSASSDIECQPLFAIPPAPAQVEATSPTPPTEALPASGVEAPNFCESCAMAAETCDCVNPKHIRVNYGPALANAAALVAGCAPYLKAGETPRERMDRDFADSQALTTLLAEERERTAAAINALTECEEYFDSRADADCDQDGFVPNKEMRLLSALRAASAPHTTAPAPQTWRGLDDKRLQRAIDAFYEPCEGTTIDGVRAAILAWEQSR